MRKKLLNNVYLILLLIFILPYNYSKLLFQSESGFITIITYAIRIFLVFYVIYYMKNLKLKEEEITVFKWLTLYFVFIFFLNIISTIIFRQSSYNDLILRMFSMVYMYGFYVYMIYNYHHFDVFNSKLKNICFFLLILSVILYFYYPSIGQLYEGYNSYAFLGVAGNRNSYFELMFPAIVSILFIRNNKLKFFDIIFIFLILATTIATKSVTSFFGIIVFFTVILLGRFFKKKSSLLKICHVGIYIIWIVFFAFMIHGKFINDFSSLFINKSSTLSGRTIIWEKSLYFIKQNPVLGYGYDNNLIGDTTNYSMQSENVFPNDTHNSIIFMLLSSGVLGTVVLIYIIIKSLNRSLLVVEHDKKYFYISAYIISFLIRGLTESCFHYPHLIFVLYLIIINIRYKELTKENYGLKGQQYE